MGFQQRPNSGSLFVVDEKKHEDDPDSTGKIDIEGVEYYIDSWLLRDPGRDQYKDTMDLRFKAKGSSRKSGDGDGSMARVDKTGKSDKYPNWKGEIRFADSGNVFEISGWRKEAKESGKPFLSLSVKRKQKQRSEPQQEQRSSQQQQRKEVSKSNDSYF